MKDYIFFYADKFVSKQFKTDEEARAAATADPNVVRAIACDLSKQIYNKPTNESTTEPAARSGDQS